MPVFCKLQLLVLSEVIFFWIFTCRSIINVEEVVKNPIFFCHEVLEKAIASQGDLGITIGLRDVDWASVWLSVSFHSASLQLCSIIMYTFPPINLPFTLDIGFFSVSQNRHFDDSPHAMTAGWGGWGEEHTCPACSNLPHPSATSDNPWPLLQYTWCSVPSHPEMAPTAHGCWTAPHLSPGLWQHCLCLSGIRVRV